MAVKQLVSLQGPFQRPLAETFSKLDPNTIQHSAEIIKARRTDGELRNQVFQVADGAVYKNEGDTNLFAETDADEVYLYLTRGKDNPIFKNIKEATDELIKGYNYVPKKEDLEAAINSETTLKVKLLDLKLQSHHDEMSYFEIDTKKYDKLNATQRALAERVYGQGKDFEENMEMFREAGILTTRICVLTPYYVKKHLISAIARVCGLDCFGFDSGFGAVGKGVGSSYGYLRGALREGIVVDAAKNLVTLEEPAMLDWLGKHVAPNERAKARVELQKLYRI